MSKLVWVELDAKTRAPIRIFKSAKAANTIRNAWTGLQNMERSEAVSAIRHYIFVRSQGCCEFCGSLVTEKTAHLHEQQHRGKGGEISITNSVIVCATCHHQAHSDREPKFTRRQQ